MDEGGVRILLRRAQERRPGGLVVAFRARGFGHEHVVVGGSLFTHDAQGRHGTLTSRRAPASEGGARSACAAGGDEQQRRESERGCAEGTRRVAATRRPDSGRTDCRRRTSALPHVTPRFIATDGRGDSGRRDSFAEPPDRPWRSRGAPREIHPRFTSLSSDTEAAARVHPAEMPVNSGISPARAFL